MKLKIKSPTQEKPFARQIDFLSDRIVLHADTDIELLYPQTSLEIIFYLENHVQTSSKSISYRPFIERLIFKFITYQIQHAGTLKQFFELVDEKHSFKEIRFSFENQNLDVSRQEFAEEIAQAIEKHNNADVNSKVPPGTPPVTEVLAFNPFGLAVFLLPLVLFFPGIGIPLTVLLIGLFYKLDKREKLKILSHQKSECKYLCELYNDAFEQNDFEALQCLAEEFSAGSAIDYWENFPDIQQKIAWAVETLAKLVESDNAPREPELEDFYYMGLMYKHGFAREQDLNKALFYFEKALATKTCRSHLEMEYEFLRKQVEFNVREINNILTKGE